MKQVIPPPPEHSTPSLFWLYRIVDSSGVSGTGYVAVGCVFPSGQVLLEWFGEHPSIEIHPSLENIQTIHGHGSNTVIVDILDLPDET